MKTWLMSLPGAVTLATLTLLSLIGYLFLMSRYFLAAWIPGEGAAMMETMGALLMIGGWLWALFAALDGRRSGLGAALAFCVLTALITLYDLPHPGPWPSLVMIVAMLVFSATAIIALVAQFKRASRR